MFPENKMLDERKKVFKFLSAKLIDKISKQFYLL